ncbi:MAG: sigma-70 family RNA polymerase sigma factor [Paracoccus sp. (in: a-proteobacteria)]|uniref:sigma-70 family RNA polymerase sigma factor n=1 Tax=Paracoccus sp. TaxID=267 RepID=UPI00391B3120
MSDDILAHVRALKAYGRSLCGNAPDAEDLVQETLLRAIEHSDSYRPGTHMRAWLFTIMRNRFYTDCRKRARERTGADDCVSGGPVMQPTQDWHMASREMQAALRDMPVHYREALVLVAVIGESYQHAAQVLDCDIGTIKSRVNRARGILRRALHEDA